MSADEDGAKPLSATEEANSETAVAEVGGNQYSTLEDAFAALNKKDRALTLLDENAWSADTPVYYKAGTTAGYAANLAGALTNAYKANAGNITIVCRPGSNLGKLTHGHVADSITIYGNNAYLSDGECDLEVDTFQYDRATGTNTGSNTITELADKSVSVNAYDVGNLGVWGQRNTNAKVNVSLTNCDGKAIAGAKNNQRVYISGTSGVNNITLNDCDFITAETAVYSNADGTVAVTDCTFTDGAAPFNFNHKASGAQKIAAKNCTFANCGDEGNWANFAAPARFVNSGSGMQDVVIDSCTFSGTKGANGDILLGDGRVGQSSSSDATTLTVVRTQADIQAQKPGYYGKDGAVADSTLKGDVAATAERGVGGATIDSIIAKAEGVAETDGASYSSLQAAIDAAKSGATVKLLVDTRENVTVSKNAIELDLNGFTLNGGTEKAKPALKVENKKVTVRDSSEAQTGTIKREDASENSGVSSHYVIDIQGKNGFLVFENGNVKNDSGVVGVSGKGASLIRLGDDAANAYPTLTINGGTFTQNNFVAVKVDRGTLHFAGGTINCENSFAVENWNNAYIKGGTINGTVSSWVYGSGAAFSKLDISAGTINGDVYSVNYKNAADRQARVYVKGGVVTGALGTYIYDDGLSPVDEAAKATIEVTGGTFANNPAKYVVEDSAVTQNENGTFGVEKAYLAEVDGTKYYTMDEAFHAAVAEGGVDKTLTLLRDYNTSKAQNSGSRSFTIDLNGHTWAANLADANSAAFEINFSDVRLTVKNGTVVSSQLAGLIPSAMSGSISYDNAGLVFDHVAMTANGHSGIETNGGNTGDVIALTNSTLNVPNGYGVYFPSSGTLAIDGSAIVSKTMGVQVCSGSLSIANSSIAVTGDAVAKTENDGAIEDGAAISVVNRPGYKGLGAVSIESGTYAAKSGNALKAYGWDNGTKSEVAFDNSKGVVSVSGGTFSNDVKDYVADGYTSVKLSDGNYSVAKKTSDSASTSKGDNTGSVTAIGDATVDSNGKVADSAAAAADVVKSLDASSDETKVGDVTVDSSSDEAKSDLNAVKAAAANSGNTVDVTLVVKADSNVAVDKQIEEAVAESSELIPFDLSVDMVTEVKGENGEKVATASVPVKQMAEPIKVTVKVDPSKLDGKTVMIARNHDGVVDTFPPESVDTKTGAITFAADKFSPYTVVLQNAAFDLSKYPVVNGVRQAPGSEVNCPDGYAFAGWYMDADFVTPCDADYAGEAYPKFDEISSMVEYLGGALRMDVSDPSSSTYLRFGYKIGAPANAHLVKNGWTYYTKEDNKHELDAYNNSLNTVDGTAISNLVLNEVPVRGYKVPVYSELYISYKTYDATVVTVKDVVRKESVLGVANKILVHPLASDSDVKYAQKIVDAVSN